MSRSTGKSRKQEEKTKQEQEEQIIYQSLKVDIPKTLHKKFKATCVMEEVEMKNVVEQLIREWLEGKEGE